MTGPTLLFAAAALLPAMTGPVPVADPVKLVLALCNGGSISIAPAPEGLPETGTVPCCAKGCHAARRRKAID